MYIMNKTMRAARPYEAPEAEEFEVRIEECILSGLTGNANTPQDLEDVDYSSSIWN